MHPCTVEYLDMRDFQHTQQVKFNLLRVQMLFRRGRHMVLLLVTSLLYCALPLLLLAAL